MTENFSSTIKPTATSYSSKVLSTTEMEEVIVMLLWDFVDDPRYDPAISNLHVYLPYTDVNLSAQGISLSVHRDFDEPEDFVELGSELILLLSIINQADILDTRFSRIEVISPGPEGSSVSLYVSGSTLIAEIANGNVDIYDVMEAEVDWGYASPPDSVQQQYGDDESAQCSCSGNLYNCDDFNTQVAAQACFNYCMNLGKGDVHWLDGDDDGYACERNP